MGVARQQGKKTYSTFVKGLITEADALTFPENASVDEDNCVLYRKGNRSRRLGFDLETNHVASSYSVVQADVALSGVSEHVWQNINNKSNLNFLVVQVGLTLHFYDLGYSITSAGEKSFTVNLSSYIAPGVASADAQLSAVSMASGRGYLFVSGENFDPFIVSYDATADTITVSKLYILVRDLQGMDDGLANDEEPVALTDAHKYNLLNQGWTQNEGTTATVTRTYYGHYGLFGTNSQATYSAAAETIITKYKTTIGRYPGNNKQWWAGKSTDQVFDPAVLNRSYWGTTLAPKGHFIINAFYIDRSAVSGVLNIAVESQTDRPVDTTFFSGRVWYLCKDTIYFSQLLDKKASNAGFCFQDQDPTAETLNELIATDGGVIPIPELGRGVKLIPMGQGLLVFGTQGVWFICGTQAGFSATDISVSKVSAIGTDAPKSIVNVEDKIFWMSKTGIQGLVQASGNLGPVFGNFTQSNISLTTIQTFFNDNIDDTVRTTVKAIFDPVNNIVQWLFRTSSILQPFFYNRILNFDLTLQAFYPWTIASSSNTYVVGVFTNTSFVNTAGTEIVRDSAGAVVTDSTGAAVTINVTTTTLQPVFTKYIVAYPSASNYVFSFGIVGDTTFADWVTIDNVGVTYTSFIDAGQEILQSPTQEKQTPYVWCFFRRTEDAYQISGTDYTLAHPSSCTFRTKWDWANSSVSNKWSASVEAYRLNRLPPVDVADLTLDTGFPIVITKNKVRGMGRALTFRFECGTIGKDFDLLGWSVNYAVNQDG